MINLNRLSLAVCIISMTALIAFADDTKGEGSGYSTIAESHKIDGKSGYIIHNTAKDFWHYEKAPKGWPTAVMATCHQTIIFKADAKAPSAISMICESVDADGDASIWSGSVDPKTGVGQGKMIFGTGKYEGAKVMPTFQTTYQIDTGHSVYKFKW